ncbi:hypothetical protein EG329_006709 [Mollisiaceae sp. DMI_Dod_QoI]|nr:hypothetical protein EG329_006709 [Helotiales sp. DMI_Dod_QoI]
MKEIKGNGKVPNKALYSRMSFLYQAATYLANQPQHSEAAGNNERSTNQGHAEAAQSPAEFVEAPNSLSRHLTFDLRSVSLKAQLRISPEMKHAICKNCDTVLIDGPTCTNEVENKSKGGKKPWADILVRKCNTCGAAKRYPLAAARQKRRPMRLETSDMPNETIQDR